MRRGTKNRTLKRRSSGSSGRPSADDYQMVVLWSPEDDCFIVSLPAWQNARTHGKTLGQAVRNGRDVLELLIKSAEEPGERIPPPERRRSGRLRLRLPSSLHDRLVLETEREGVSLNQWIVTKLAS